MPLAHSADIEKLAAALAKAQGDMDDAAKDSMNPHFKSAYSDLASVRAAVRKPLSANGLSYVQFPESEGNKVSCETMLMHDSGQWMRGVLTMTATQANPQGIGSAITYCRRYSLMAVLGIAPSEDDDGNEASQRVPNDNRSGDDRTVTLRRDEYKSAPPAMPPSPPRLEETPFDDIPYEKPPFEPAVSTKAVALGREMKTCKSIPDLNSFKKSAEFKAAFDAMNDVDKEYLVKMIADVADDIRGVDLRMAG